MLNYTDLKPGVDFIKDGQPYIVIDYTHVKKQRGTPIVRLKIKNIITKKTKDITVHQNEKYEEPEIEEISTKFIYHQNHKNEYWFECSNNENNRISLNGKLVNDAKNYLIQGLEVKLMKYKNNFVDLKIPIKVNLEVKIAPPNIDGNTANGGNKKVTIETGYKITTPLFIEKGDIIKINTETGEYIERVSKK